MATSAGGLQSMLQAAGGVGEKQRLAAEPLEGLDGDRHRARVAAFVIMAAALKQRDALALELADHQPPAMARTEGCGKPGISL